MNRGCSAGLLACEFTGRPARYVFSAMVGMARCAVPARVVAGGTNIRATLAFEEIAPLHAARTSQRDVPTTLNRSTAATLGVAIACSGVAAVRVIFPGWSAGGREFKKQWDN